MPLRLKLKPNERFIVTGCVLRNGPRRHELEVENRADVLRGDDMLDSESATTPARRLAYDIQIALVSKQHRDAYRLKIQAGLDALILALPRFTETLRHTEELLAAEDYYAAFRSLSAVIAHEDHIFSLLKDDIL